MALEAGDGFISGLVATNPVNATDQVAQGDDHIRLIKTALKGTFPNLNGAVNATPAQLNVLKTDGDGAGMLADIAAIADPGADRVLGWDESANAAIAFSLAGGLTSSGTQLIVGGADPLRAAQGSAAAPAFSFTLDTNTGWYSGGADDIRLSVGGSILGVFTAAEIELNTTLFDLNGNLDLSGTVTSPNTSASEVGYKGAPQNAQNGDYTLVLTDAGKTIYKASGGAGETITIPANASVAFPVGTIIRIVNNGGGDLTIAITSDTLSLAGAGTTGSRTLSDHGIAVIEKVSSTEWFISGVGLT